MYTRRFSLCTSFFLFITSPLLFSTPSNAFGGDAGQLKNYIILVRHSSEADTTSHDDRINLYASLLSDSITTDDASSGSIAFPADRIFYTYSQVTNGFAARLTENEVEAISKKEWFVSAIPDRVLKLMTTHTPKFLGLPARHRGAWNESHMGEGVIIAMLDTGIRPDHPSFDDKGMLPPPPKWRGRCDFKKCNNKLIGAQSFINSTWVNVTSNVPPFDQDGHGTHTASTAAGAFVPQASMFGNARGIASGMAPRAHLAVYKVCSNDSCYLTDITAGMDAAIFDGADVLSLSLGGDSVPYYYDITAASAFLAITKGVFVSFAAGNSGPETQTISNGMPWVVTVAASTMDRAIVSTVKLGNGLEFDGQSLYQPKNFTTELLPLVYAGDSLKPNSSYCVNGTFDEAFDIRGKIVACERGANSRIDKGLVVLAAGGVGMIYMNREEDGYSTNAFVHSVPTSHVSYAHATEIITYIRSTPNPTATLVFRGTVMHVPSSPMVAAFSSRGPSILSPGILKPDVTGPGVDVLAAWHEPVVNSTMKKTAKNFNMISGTSMSTPHISGIAALIKSVHPDWSPAAIKSAIMTTAYQTARNGKPITDQSGDPADYFGMGAGHVNPRKVLHPGLVYDITPDEYISYLCGLRYTDEQVGLIVRLDSAPVNCSSLRKIPESQLNYPSIVVSLADNSKKPVRIVRTVTNVGEVPATYFPVIDVPEGVSASVVPTNLTFKYVNQKKRFILYFTRSGGFPGTVQGQLKWLSRKYVVKSPISINFM